MLPTGSLPSSLGVCGGGLHVSGWSCLGEILRQPGTRTKARSGAPSTRGGPTPLWAQTWAKPSGISSSAPPPLPPAAGLDLGPAPPVSPRGKWTGTEKDLTPFLVPFPTAWGGGRDEGGGGSLHPQPQHPEPGEESFPTTLLCPGGCLLSRTRCPSAEAGSSEGRALQYSEGLSWDCRMEGMMEMLPGPAQSQRRSPPGKGSPTGTRQTMGTGPRVPVGRSRVSTCASWWSC